MFKLKIFYCVQLKEIRNKRMVPKKLVYQLEAYLGIYVVEESLL